MKDLKNNEKPKRNIRKPMKAGNSVGITIPSFYFRYLEDQGKIIENFEFKIHENHTITVTPIFKKK